MADNSRIQWTDASWNPIRARIPSGKVGWHCEHVTPGCEHCYAESMNMRLGTGLPFKPGHRKDIEIFLDELTLTQPLRWKRPRMIFVCSMTDVFADFVPDEWLDKMFAVMALASQHTFQVLTKRSARMRAYFAAADDESLEGLGARWCRAVHAITGGDPGECPEFPLPNVWLGVSAEDQERFNERWPLLRDTPASVRFLSIEPQLGRVDMCEALGIWWNQTTDTWVVEGDRIRPDWVIVGGESGYDARPFYIEWAESLIRQCTAAGIACFVKQLGRRPVQRGPMYDEFLLDLLDTKGGSIEEWPPHLRVREMPV